MCRRGRGIYFSENIKLKVILSKNLAREEKFQLDEVLENSFLSAPSLLFVRNLSDMPAAADDKVNLHMISKVNRIKTNLLESGIMQNLSSKLEDIDSGGASVEVLL